MLGIDCFTTAGLKEVHFLLPPTVSLLKSAFDQVLYLEPRFPVSFS